MLVQITQRKPGTQAANAAVNAIGALLECHDRIRYFMRVAHRIANTSVEIREQDASDLTGAAAEVYRYFTVALPLHSADEDLSFLPRVNAHTPALRDSLASMEAQHVEIDNLLRQLCPMWDEISREPIARKKHEKELTALTGQLQVLWDTHLKMEETLIFPTANQFLIPADHESIRDEMRQRRA